MVLAIPDENYGERGTVSDDPIIIAGESDSAYAVPFDSIRLGTPADYVIHSLLFTPPVLVCAPSETQVTHVPLDPQSDFFILALPLVTASGDHRAGPTPCCMCCRGPFHMRT